MAARAWNRIGTSGQAMTGLLVALAYGLTGEMLFQQTSDRWFGTLCLSFLVVLPFGIGALTSSFAPAAHRTSWPYAIFAPWGVCVALGVAVSLAAWELWVCVVMALPIFLVMSSAGGSLVLWRRNRTGTRSPFLPALLLAPFLLAPFEAQWQPPMTARSVVTSVVVDATPQAIWDNFISVPEIRPEELRIAWFRVLGLPDPVAATLSGPGKGGMRVASYDNGLPAGGGRACSETVGTRKTDSGEMCGDNIDSSEDSHGTCCTGRQRSVPFAGVLRGEHWTACAGPHGRSRSLGGGRGRGIEDAA